MKHDGRRGRDYSRINGTPRNLTGRLSDEELKAMGSSLRRIRHTDGLTDRERRAALVKSRGVDIKREDGVK